MRELRCNNRMHGVILEDGILEVKCGNNLCGARSGVIVLHRFDLNSGELIDTKKFSDPKPPRKEVSGNGTSRIRAAIRSS